MPSAVRTAFLGHRTLAPNTAVTADRAAPERHGRVGPRRRWRGTPAWSSGGVRMRDRRLPFAEPLGDGRRHWPVGSRPAAGWLGDVPASPFALQAMTNTSADARFRREADEGCRRGRGRRWHWRRLLGLCAGTGGARCSRCWRRLEYPDRVRGESMHAWGLLEARKLGVESVLLDAGAHITPVWKQFIEGIGEAGDIPVGMMVPGIAGTLNLRHPVACQALVEAAAAAGDGGARRRGRHAPARGATDDPHTRRRRAAATPASIVVGADGRASTVRRQAGISLERQAPTNYVAGCSSTASTASPTTTTYWSARATPCSSRLHQGAGRARLYLVPRPCRTAPLRRSRRHATVPRCLPVSRYPWSEQVASANPIGPIAMHLGDDTWTDTPYVDGLVLIGDAAGYNDPIIGEGLSIALRDARIVRDLIVDGAWHTAFTPYGLNAPPCMERLLRRRPHLRDTSRGRRQPHGPSHAGRPGKWHRWTPRCSR